jgi:hypothetical protein
MVTDAAVLNGGGEDGTGSRHHPSLSHAVRRPNPSDLCAVGANEMFRTMKWHYSQYGFWESCDASRFIDAMCEAGAILRPTQPARFTAGKNVGE